MLVVSKTHGMQEAISVTGYHVGINVNGVVYDNIHTAGMNFEDWVNDFMSRGEHTVTSTPF